MTDVVRGTAGVYEENGHKAGDSQNNGRGERMSKLSGLSGRGMVREVDDDGCN
jgi:hypothetical protein